MRKDYRLQMRKWFFPSQGHKSNIHRKVELTVK